MVRAILDGRKTQTRRVAKLDPRMNEGEEGDWSPYGRRGDVLWVKETFWVDRREPNGCVIYAEEPSKHKYRNCGVVEESEHGCTTAFLEGHEFWMRRPSIFMPKWASRITLQILSVRVERLQHISEADARLEGCEPRVSGRTWGGDLIKTYRTGFVYLWNELNERRGQGWLQNPWVWRIEFRPLCHGGQKRVAHSTLSRGVDAHGNERGPHSRRSPEPQGLDGRRVAPVCGDGSERRSLLSRSAERFAGSPSRQQRHGDGEVCACDSLRPAGDGQQLGKEAM